MKLVGMIWDMEQWFAGGSRSETFLTYLQTITQNMKQLKAVLMDKGSIRNVTFWVDFIQQIQSIANHVRHASNFVECLAAQDVEDMNAKKLENHVLQLEAMYQSLLIQFERYLGEMTEKQWQQIIHDKHLQSISYPLAVRRKSAQEQRQGQETLANELAVDGYHAWGKHQLSIISKLRISVDTEKNKQGLTMGQAMGKLSDPQGQTRKAVFDQIIKSWDKIAPLSADALNHLAGFRLTRYRHKGWHSVLKEPLVNNRISQQTLEAMWEAVAQNRTMLTKYLDKKRQLLQLDHLNWYDLNVPLNSQMTKINYQEAAHVIRAQVAKCSPKLAEVVQRAFSENWIDAEARPTKTAGGFCTPSPIAKQSRIILTYHPSIRGCAQLAHELGHAYHQFMMHDLPAFIQRFPMTLAEAASIFTEMLVYDHFQQKCNDKNEMLALLDSKLQNAVLLLMNMCGRFLFEKRFYEARQYKYVDVDALNDLMVEAQREAFANGLASYFPYQWATKEHFYLTDIPFYNFPYTFGYLFSMGLFARYRELGDHFEEEYLQLLRDSGRMQVEDLAKKYLGMDLTQTHFWQSALNEIANDVEAFIQLAGH